MENLELLLSGCSLISVECVYVPTCALDLLSVDHNSFFLEVKINVLVYQALNK